MQSFRAAESGLLTIMHPGSAGHDAQLAACNMSLFQNFWSDIFDFTPSASSWHFIAPKHCSPSSMQHVVPLGVQVCPRSSHMHDAVQAEQALRDLRAPALFAVACTQPTSLEIMPAQNFTTEPRRAGARTHQQGPLVLCWPPGQSRALQTHRACSCLC